ncbi:hypothetical protein L2E82_02064 [Cichorium intybus]|uniref:Uncharacterized protein n=1 Tax=Cichorium intybus TaxID=13427 RepID=A0ACB9H151_CICIN|nr:hypothetical protein L2E82_02064 [Cichorium intybus]
MSGGDHSDHAILLWSNSSSSDKDLEGQVSSAKSSGRSTKSIKDLWNRLDRAFSGRRLSIKRRSPRARRSVRIHISPRRVLENGDGAGDDEILGDGAPPEWALPLSSEGDKGEGPNKFYPQPPSVISNLNSLLIFTSTMRATTSSPLLVREKASVQGLMKSQQLANLYW